MLLVVYAAFFTGAGGWVWDAGFRGYMKHARLGAMECG